MNAKKLLTTAIATGTLLLSGLTPVFAADVVVTGNGAWSSNNVNVSSNHEMEIIQKNMTDTVNTVISNALTGGNNASFNTGGNTSVTSGPATSTVGIVNEGSKNILSVPSNCGCNQQDTSVVVAGNGAGSHNYISANSNDETHLVQANNTHVTNTVYSTAATGGNTASFNTGSSGNVWYPTMHSYNTNNNYDWMKQMYVLPHVLGNGGSTSVYSGPAYSNVGIFNGGNMNVLY